MRSAVSSMLIGAAAAAQWYGIAPDTTIPGVVNLFAMTPQGIPTRSAGAIATNDREYPKTGTLHCSWATPLCYFATGVGAPYIQDALYAVDRTTGQTAFKHTIPAGIYIDNLAYDYIHEELWSVSFDPAAPGGGAAGLVSWSPTQGNLTSFTDISQYLRGGFVWAGDFTLCASTRRIYIGIDSQVPGFQDRVLVFDASTTPPSFVAEVGLFFPVPTSMHAFCNATSLVALAATTVQADSFVRETLLIGNVIAAGREGLFLPFAQGDLPTFQQRNEVPLFLNGMMSEFAGQVLIPVFPVFNAGPGPAPPVVGGLLYVSEPFTPGPPNGQFFPLNYFLAGASGVPNQ